MSFDHNPTAETRSRKGRLRVLGAALLTGAALVPVQAQAQNITSLFIRLGTLSGSTFTPNGGLYDTEDQTPPVAEIYVGGVSSNVSLAAPLLNNPVTTQINIPGTGAYNIYANPGAQAFGSGVELTLTYSAPLSATYVYVFNTTTPTFSPFTLVSATAGAPTIQFRYQNGSYTVNRVGANDNLNPAGSGLDVVYELTSQVPTDEPLPVELQSFSGASSQGVVRLGWSTASERDNAGFSVIRNGVEIATYSAVPGLTGQGNSSQGAKYSFTDTRVRIGETYVYKLRSFDRTGIVHDMPHTVRVEVSEQDAAPNAFVLHSAQPNPFNPTTQIPFDLPEAARVTATLYNTLGQPVRVVLAGDQRGAGPNQVVAINAEGLPSGVYMVRFTAIGMTGSVYSQTQRVVLAK